MKQDQGDMKQTEPQTVEMKTEVIEVKGDTPIGWSSSTDRATV